MRKLASLLLLALASPVLGKGAISNQTAVYQSQDGQTELIVSGMYYYLGPIDHPEVNDFVRQYGDKLEYQSISGGTCLSLGVFKLAIIQGTTSVCQNVHIEKLARGGDHGVNDYVATCFELNGPECAPANRTRQPALVYGYKVEEGRGITEIYLSDRSNRSAGNTLVLKSDSALLN